MLALAELACKQARAEGGNRRQFFLPSDTVSPQRERELIAVASLQRALKGNHLRLLAQPIVDAGDCSGAPAGYEILVRMRDDAGSLLAPGEFLDAARRYRLTPAVDQWVFTSQLRELGSFDGSLANLSVGICVNVSEQSLASRDYRAAILSALDDSDLPAELFCFEFSESTAISRAADAEAFINTVRAAGCRAALDNFGRGLTSISHLRRLNVDFLKIDGRLIRGMREDRYQSSMVLGLVSAAQSLNIRIVAEQVEDPSLVEQLQKLGFDYLQGFAFGQPKPLLRLLAEGSNSSAPLIASQS
jgi:EAL domain-containing protein (putative c-di-GMP-specific phosphodiesterase class I)